MLRVLTLRRRGTPPLSGSRLCERARRRTDREWPPGRTCRWRSSLGMVPRTTYWVWTCTRCPDRERTGSLKTQEKYWLVQDLCANKCVDINFIINKVIPSPPPRYRSILWINKCIKVQRVKSNWTQSTRESLAITSRPTSNISFVYYGSVIPWVQRCRRSIAAHYHLTSWSIPLYRSRVYYV